MTPRAASHVLMVAPNEYRTNAETAESNAFQHAVAPAEAAGLAARAVEQHRRLRDQLIENGVQVTVARSLRETPDAAFCNNWFSTHQSAAGVPATLVLYPMMAPSRRLERRPELVRMLSQWYPRQIDYSSREADQVFLESTGSLCLDDTNRVAYAAISIRTDLGLTREWARALNYRLVAFEATDASGLPYYHTNVMMFLGHGLAGICLDSITETGRAGMTGRRDVLASLEQGGFDILPITRDQVMVFGGNCLPLVNDLGEALLVMSTAADGGFADTERAIIGRHARIVHTDLSAFETLGGGSARCLLGELF